MGTTSEHIIKRDIFDHKVLSIYNIRDVIDAQSRIMLDSINSLSLTDDMIYINALNKKNLCKKYCDNIYDKHEIIKKILSSNLITTEYNFDSLQQKLLSKDMIFPKSNIFDIEIFLAELLDFSITIEPKIKAYFDISRIKDSEGKFKISTFQDNTRDSCSDKIILFNLSMILVVNETTEDPLPFPIINKSINCSIPEKNDSLESNTDRLYSVYNALNKINFKNTSHLFSEECVHFFIACKIMCDSNLYITIINIMKKYLDQEKELLLELYSAKHFEFIIGLLPYWDSEINSPCDITEEMIKTYYTSERKKYDSLKSDLKDSASELSKKYRFEVSNLMRPFQKLCKPRG